MALHLVIPAYAASEPSNIFASLPESFTFTSGAGAWSTEVHINADGTFTGYYEDWDMGDNSEEYPNGTKYESIFSGGFINLTKLSDYEYSMQITNLNVKGIINEHNTIDGARIITSEPYGFAGTNEFRLYLPGIATTALSPSFLGWVRAPLMWRYDSTTPPPTLPFYALYNVGEKQGFYPTSEIDDMLAKETEKTYILESSSSSHVIGTLTVSSSNPVTIRNRPTQEGNPLVKIAPDKSYECVGQDPSGWYIVYCNGYIGYVPNGSVSISPSSPQATVVESILGVVEITSNDFANVRTIPNQDGDWLAGISPGVTLDCVEVANNGWYGVVLPSGEVGYVSNKLCHLHEAN